jgi:hypothetical protein
MQGLQNTEKELNFGLNLDQGFGEREDVRFLNMQGYSN